MRDAFFRALFEEARRDPRIVLVNPDTAGFYCEAFRREIPDQYLNVGIAEQNAVGVCAGLALTGRRPFLFNILAFNSFRCFEQVRLDVCVMKLGVVLVGVGAGFDYGLFGPSHHTMEDLALMRSLPGMAVWSPADEGVAAALVPSCVEAGGPAYLRLDRTGTPLVYPSGATPQLSDGLAVLLPGRDLLLAATGRMVRRAMEVASALRAASVDAGVVIFSVSNRFPKAALWSWLVCRTPTSRPSRSTLHPAGWEPPCWRPSPIADCPGTCGGSDFPTASVVSAAIATTCTARVGWTRAQTLASRLLGDSINRTG